MEMYMKALEAFEKETYEVYGDYMMGSFIATEGVGSTVAQKLSNGWRTLCELAARIWNFIKSVCVTIGSAIGKFLKISKNSPNEITASSRKVEEVVTKIEKIADTETRQTGEVANMSDEAERLMEESVNMLNTLPTLDLGDAEEWEERIKELEAKHQRTLNEIHEQHRKDMSELDQLEADLDEDMKNFDRASASGDLDAMLKATRNMTNKMASYNAGHPATAKESYGDAMEADRSFKINIAGLKSKLNSNGENAKKSTEKNERLMAKINNVLSRFKTRDSASVDDSTEVQKETILQRGLSKLLRILSNIGKFFASIPSNISSLFGKIFAKRPKTTVTEYDGPSPEVG